jgi:hypothetical protein
MGMICQHPKVKQPSLRTLHIIFLAALGRDADFLYDTINTSINDAQSANRSDLVSMWNTIKQDR